MYAVAKLTSLTMLLGVLSMLPACGVLDSSSSGTGTGTGTTAQTFAVRASVSGLLGQGLVLQNNGQDDLSVSRSGSATFATRLAGGSHYSVTVLSRPVAPSQTCVVVGGAGSLSGADASVQLNCSVDSFSIGGNISGLVGTGLVLRNAGEVVRPGADGTFTFLNRIASGERFDITVTAQPTGPSQNCALTGGSGTVADHDVTDIAVTCTASSLFSVGGTVTGLVGTGLVLQNNIADILGIAGNGPFAFSTLLPGGGSYSVAAISSPTNPSQTCTVSNGTGLVVNANVVGIGVSCATNSYAVGVTVSGLAGTGLVIQNNGSDSRSVSANGTFTFATPLASGASFLVTVLTQPNSPSQTCVPIGSSGTITASGVTVPVTCTTVTHKVSVNVVGLTGSGFVLQNNGSDDLAIPTDGAYDFSTRIASGAGYDVTVRTQPGTPTQHCVVTGSTGSVTISDISVNVVCRTVGRFVYTANDVGDVSAFMIDPVSGGLTPVPGSPFAAGMFPGAIAVDPQGRFAYVANLGDSTLSAYRIDASSGALNPVSPVVGNPYAVGANPQTVAVDPTGRFVYVANYDDDTISAFTIDAATGALTAMAGSPFASLGVNPRAVTIDPTGRFAYVINYAFAAFSAFAIDPAAGVLTPLPGAPFFFVTGFGPYSMAITPDGQFTYFANNDGSHHVSGLGLEPVTGGPRAVLANSPYPFNFAVPWAVTVDPTGNFLYVLDTLGENVSAFGIDRLTGDLTASPSGPFLTGHNPRSIAVDPSGQFTYVANMNSDSVSAYQIDALTGALAAVGGGPFPTDSLPAAIAISR